MYLICIFILSWLNSAIWLSYLISKILRSVSFVSYLKYFLKVSSPTLSLCLASGAKLHSHLVTLWPREQRSRSVSATRCRRCWWCFQQEDRGLRPRDVELKWGVEGEVSMLIQIVVWVNLTPKIAMSHTFRDQLRGQRHGLLRGDCSLCTCKEYFSKYLILWLQWDQGKRVTITNKSIDIR